jgi:heparin/heparan-sulfate lyase
MSWTLAETHPRVLFNSADLPILRKRAATTHQREMNSLLHTAAEISELPDAGQCNALAFRLAFLYQLSGDGKHAALAARCLEKSLELGVDANYGGGSSRLKTLACCYDWLHGALSDDLRVRVGQRALEQSQALYNSEEVEPHAFVAGHGVNQVPYILMAGLAVGEDFGGAEIPHVPRPLTIGPHTHNAIEYVNEVLWRIEQMFACYKHFLDGYSFSQSYAYSLAYVGEIPYMLQLMERGCGIDAFKNNPWFENIVEWYTYALRQDNTFIRYGDYFCSNSIFTSGYMYRPMAAVATRYKNPVARWWANKFDLQDNEIDAVVLDSREGEAKDPETLPRSRLFPTMGIAIARGDFKQGTLAAFKCSPLYLHNHCHRDQNQITIYHKGEQAIDSGAYDGYESPHWKNYYIRTIAHNTLVVHDPEELINMRGWILANDGGQRQVNIPDFAMRRFRDLSKDCFRDGKILGYREGNGFSYVCGDASNCYRPEKLKRYLRHVVFVLDYPHPAAVSLVVFDEVTLARKLLPRILLHTVNEPEVEGARVRAAHGEGRLEMHVLEPNGFKLEKIGGAGRECWVDGKNFPVDYQADENLSTRAQWHNPGSWRVEVSPEAPCLETEFLTVWIPHDASAKAPPAPKLESTSAGRIVRLGEKSVGLFRSADASKVSIGVELFKQ